MSSCNCYTMPNVSCVDFRSPKAASHGAFSADYCFARLLHRRIESTPLSFKIRSDLSFTQSL